MIKPLVAGGHAAHVSLMHVVLLPGQGPRAPQPPGRRRDPLRPRRHRRADGRRRQPFRVRPGQTIFIPKAAFHSTSNTGWEPMTLLAIYAPGGAETVLGTLPDHRELAPGGFLGSHASSHRAGRHHRLRQRSEVREAGVGDERRRAADQPAPRRRHPRAERRGPDTAGHGRRRAAHRRRRGAIWLRLAKTGNTYRAHYSDDGSAGNALRTGPYSKTLAFSTLSTTAP